MRRPDVRGGADDLRAAREALCRAPIGLIGQWLSWSVFTWIFFDIAPEGPWWAAAVGALPCWMARAGLLAHRLAPGADSVAGVLQWHRHDRSLLTLQGLILGLACGVHQARADGMQNTLLLMAAFCACLQALPSLALRAHRLWLHAAATLGPLALALVADAGNPHQMPLVAMLLLLLATVMWVGVAIRAHLRALVHLRRGVVDLRRDLTTEQNQAQAAQALMQARQRGQALELLGWGHDVRQPLLALALQVRQADWHLERSGQTALADSLMQGVQALERMVDTLIDRVRCEADMLQPQPRRIRLQEVYDRLQAQLGPVAFDRGLDLRWRGGARHLTADPVLLERLLRNLAVNALDHTERGGVLVSARAAGRGLRLQVWDSGPGLPAGWSARLFQQSLPACESLPGSRPQVHHHAAAANRLGGSGQGLQIVQRLAHRMGAEITARSRSGRGTVFEIRWQEGASPPLQDGW